MTTATAKREKPAVATACRWKLRKGAVEWQGCLLDPVTAAEACRIFRADSAEPIPNAPLTAPTAAQEAELRELVHSVLGEHPDAPDAIACGLVDIDNALASWRLLAREHAEREEWKRRRGRA